VTRDLSALFAQLGLTTGATARLLGVDVRTVQRWVAGERDVPEPAWRLLNLALDLPQARERLASYCTD
jgi:DNA-binding transcriptional regulator YiaG